MHYSAIFPVLAAGLAAAAPVEQRDVARDFNPPPGGDVTILNYALTLEYLERKFYQEGLANYSHADFVAAGFPDPFYANLKEIYYDEEVSFA
jgi:Ferritin-like domain